MTFYSFLSSILSYVFITVIFLFIFSVIRLIYMDIRKMSRFENNNATDEPYACLRPVKSKIQVKNPLPRRYDLNGQPVIIGRRRDCDIFINESFVSAQQCQIWHEDGEWYLADMGSRNGTYVNEQKIKDVIALDSGDVISLGGLNLLFEL